MRYRYQGIIILFLCVPLLILPGCISLRTADTHDTTTAIQSYNTWVSVQQVFDRDTRNATRQIGEHISTYNGEIAKNDPEYSLLQQNLASDRQLLDQWGTGLDNLSAATEKFEADTVTLAYDNASKVKVMNELAMIDQYMKIYETHMGNARQHLIEYVNDAKAYTGPEDPDYWNEKYRQAAMQAKDQAQESIAEADLALGNLTLHARNLEQLQ